MLTSGQISIAQHDLTLIGPGRSRLTLDGNHASRIFLHDAGDTAPGNLVIKSMSIANGHVPLPPGFSDPPPTGGCINSRHNVELNGVDLHGCLVDNEPDIGCVGGGASVDGSLRIINSNVFSNAAPGGFGGGASASDVVVYRSRIYNNQAQAGGGLGAGKASLSYSTVDGNTTTYGDTNAQGGGIYSDILVVNKSTVSNNMSLGHNPDGGGAHVRSLAYVYDSTFSGNASYQGSALYGFDVRISNSTLAFNQENQGDSPLGSSGAVAAATVYVNSSILARNRLTGGAGAANDIGPMVSVRGGDNIIERSPSPLPADTLSINPLLAPLASNGGPTRTHALLNGSPAIDRGNNIRRRLYDQRGPGFSRVKGAAADIGAFEH